MKSEIKEKFQNAVKIKEQGDSQTAKEILKELAIYDPNSVAIIATLGDVCWELKEYKEAINAFEQATKMAPKLEAVSLGLFHCLWESDQKDSAMEELKRFQKISYSEDYEMIIKEINEK